MSGHLESNLQLKDISYRSDQVAQSFILVVSWSWLDVRYPPRLSVSLCHNTNAAILLLLLSLSFYCCADVIWRGISLWSAWVNCSFSKILPTPSLVTFGIEGGERLERQSWYCMSTAQQQSKHWYVINTFLVIIPTQTTELWGLLWGKLTPSQPNQIQPSWVFNTLKAETAQLLWVTGTIAGLSAWWTSSSLKSFYENDS